MGEFMKLQDVKKDYGLIVSLGSSCAPAINLKRYGLRKFSMPLDWMISYSLADVNRLLKNEFKNFMDFRNLHPLDETHFCWMMEIPYIWIIPGTICHHPISYGTLCITSSLPTISRLFQVRAGALPIPPTD